MEQNEAAPDVVHPEVRAHINSLVSALGGFDEDGQYQLGDDALEVLRDIKKWMRFYDQKLNRMDVARCVSETNLVNGDILAILASWNENATLQRFRSRVALACYELMTPLTWPLEKDAETATVNYYRHLPVLQLAQVGYKRAIINYDGAQILHTAVRVALPSMAVPLGDRTLRDHGVIRLVLFFLRNIVMIEPPAGVKYDGDESQISRSATIDAFSYQEIFLVLLTMASNMGEDFRTEDSTVMEIIFHLVKGVDTAKLFMNEAQLSTAKASELTDMMKKEEAMLHAFNQNGPTRHSRFGTMVWVDRGEGKMSALSGQDALLSSAAREQKMDSSKKYRPPRRGRRGPDKQDLVGLGGQISLNSRANGQLRKFVEEFLDAGFNPLFQHVRRSIDREAPHILHHHRAQFFYLTSWFLAAERERQKAQRSKKKADQNKKQKTPSNPDEVTSFNLVAGVLSQEMFIFLGRALDRSYNDKDWKELSVVMRCFTQILLTVQEMFESGNEDDEEIAENILSRLFYEDTTHDAVANIIKSYKDQGHDYLDSCTELVHTYLRILEAYSKQNVDLHVRTRQRTRKKKKAAKAAAAADAAAGGAVPGGEDAVPGADDDEGDESANDEELAQKASSERKFDFKRFANRFVSQGVVDTFVKFTANYKDMTDEQLKRAHRYFYRVAFKQDMSVMLFRVDIIKLFYDMIKGTTPLDRHSSMYREWEELSKQILRRCMKKIEERPVLIIEMLFSKTPSTAHFLEYGFEKQTVSTTTPKPAAEHDFREPDLERDRQIAILIAVMLNKNQHELISWIKGQIGMAGAERRAWKSAETARALAAIESSTATAGDGEAEALANLAVSVANDAPSITIRAADDACKKAMFKNPHLRLLMKTVGFQRLAPSLDETPDSIWVIPSHVTADELEESLEFISRAEFEPPTFDNDQSAEDQIKRKPAARKKAAFDDDDGDDVNDILDDGDALFPAGGPTARKVVSEPKKKTIRRRRRQALGSDDELPEGPTEEELDEKARQRREKELEKARRVKSDMYVHASDDETDDEKDREFFEREEATRQRIQNLAALVSSQPRPSILADASKAASTLKSKSKATKKAKAKRKSGVLSDDSDDDVDEDSDGESAASSSQASAPTSRRSRKRRKPSEEPAGSSEDSEGDAEDEDEDKNEDEDDMDVDPQPAAKKRLSKRRHVGFVDSSDEDEEETSAAKDKENDGMDIDAVDVPSVIPSTSVLSEIHLNSSNNAAKADVVSKAAVEDEDDEDDDLPVVKRPRAKAGFVMDSDDE